MLEKKYDHKLTEENKYDKWKENGYFKSGDKSKEPFCIVLPPPNVTGKLHLGHALDVSIQDVIIRYKRMQGYDAFWLPGMDHAAIATESKVVKRLKDNGQDKTTIGRDKFIEECWNWTQRPETLFGDTAVAVNPKDARYQKYIGKNVVLPIVNKLIPVIADEHADMEKGTGCVNVTPFSTNKLKILKNKGFKKLITFNNINNEEEKIAC